MNHFWEQQLLEIREQLLMMSSLTERALSTALRALVERSDALADLVEKEDSQIDHLEIHVDELVISYMATRAPVARDCRLMLAASKISSNLERIGDQATTISRRARDLNAQPSLKPLGEVMLMEEIGQGMLRDSITAFVEARPELALEIIARDQKVNQLYKQLAGEWTADMVANPEAIIPGLSLLTVAKALERVADHATNIAEEVFYLYKGEDIRHERTLPK